MCDDFGIIKPRYSYSSKRAASMCDVSLSRISGSHLKKITQKPSMTIACKFSFDVYNLKNLYQKFKQNYLIWKMKDLIFEFNLEPIEKAPFPAKIFFNSEFVGLMEQNIIPFFPVMESFDFINKL